MTLVHEWLALPSLSAVVLSALVLLGWGRLGWWQWRAPGAQRSQAWRIVVLCGLQALAALLLYLALWPPQREVAAQTMTVLTAGAEDAVEGDAAGDEGDADEAGGPAGLVVALPEAQATTAIRVPDLATALRQHPGGSHLQVRGAGLRERDRDAIAGRALSYPLSYQAPPAPVGVVRLDLPDNVVAGAGLRLSGQVHGVPAGKVEWLDPAGRRADVAGLDAQGRFSLDAVAFAAGPPDYLLRVRDASGAIVQDATIPLLVHAPALPRVLLLSGPPNPETRALRRWLGDAGMSVHAQLALGGGLQLGDGAVAMTPAGLSKFDVLVVDARAWEGLGEGGRTQVIAAVRQGLGLLLRVDQPLSAGALRPLRTPRFVPGAGQQVVALALPPARVDDEAAARARMGVGTADAPFDATIAAEPVPALVRRALTVNGADAVAFGRDVEGAPWGWWRSEGQGRLALWTPLDSWRLPLAGRPDLHADLWNQALSRVARALPMSPLQVADDPEVGQRTTICGVDAAMQVVAPEGAGTPLVADPATSTQRCAGFWPTQAGWHRVASQALPDASSDDASAPRGVDGGVAAHWFHVRAASPMPTWRAAALREATLALASQDDARPPSTQRSHLRGPAWPWLLGWLLAGALLWWTERSQWGRRRPTQA